MKHCPKCEKEYIALLGSKCPRCEPQAAREIKPPPVMEQEDEVKRERFRLEQEIADLHLQVRRWKRMASWLASCHAANLEELPVKTSQVMRIRCTTICKNFILFVGGAWEPRSPTNTSDTDADVSHEVIRCDQAIDKYGQTEKVKTPKKATFTIPGL